MKALLFIILFYFSVPGRAQMPIIDAGRWFKVPQPKGAVLLLHGFNVKPAKMDTLATAIASWGYDVYRPALSGHRGIVGEMQKTSPSYWVDETWASLRTLASLTKSGTPIYFVGVSMGGVILNQVFEKYPEARGLVKKSVLISPSLSFSFFARSPGYLMLHDTYPLFSPEQEWDADFVTLGTFKGLLKLYYEARETKFTHMNRPTLILLHPQDKIIIAADIPKLKDDLKMSQWEIVWLPETALAIGNPNNHLLVDQNTAGPHVWRTLLQKTKVYLEK